MLTSLTAYFTLIFAFFFYILGISVGSFPNQILHFRESFYNFSPRMRAISRISESRPAPSVVKKKRKYRRGSNEIRSGYRNLRRSRGAEELKNQRGEMLG